MTKASPSTLRSFGLTVGGILLLMGLWWVHRGKFGLVGPGFAVAGGILLLAGVAAPRLLARPYSGWMALAEGLAFVMTRVILFLVFVLVVTPIGLLRRAVGGDPLRRRAKATESYWHPYPERHRDLKHYEKSF